MPSNEAPRTKVSRTASSVHDVSAEKPPFGSRFLTSEADVWSQNAWDHVPPPDDQDGIINAALARQKLSPVPDNEKQKYNDKPAKHWDNFYKMNSSNFFKNRNWLHLEFPELVRAAQAEAGAMTIAEIGCGAGNAVFPILSSNQNPQLSLRAYDYSSHAVKLVQSNPLYTAPPVGSIRAAVWDLSSSELPPDTAPESVDIIILVFVLSALHPQEWQRAVQNIHKMLKPGGLVLLRDYGRYDLTQLRFKGGRLLDENFYIRGDKTRVYFFDLDELALLFTGSLAPSSSKANNRVTVVEEDDGNSDDPSRQRSTAPVLTASPGPSSPQLLEPEATALAQESSSATPSTSAQIHPCLHPILISEDTVPLFAIEQLGIDRRLIVNRKRQLKMYRVWIQAKLRRLPG
ncbi:methyltransferase [Rhodofomes roseus]|uniref:tRNA N(3)-methylcytidine methyltransferase n=1 Tax=Rhodofomes roseus TaxID=34475 RepID=A0ABQ8KP02_9APHY|nr:methyltransferase [Rhodofomes roseus]KAH9839690.1 methyltransferase [Rhodofomes roseus]